MISSATALAGTFTALVTPFRSDGSLDLPGLDALVDGQIQAGVAGVVPCGTTGEASTLTADERDTVLARVVTRAAGRIVVMAGTGTNSTAGTIENQRRARAMGADCGLVVTPYYNKPSPEGLVRHYTAVAQAVDLPLLIYNVPGRTACDCTPEVVGRLHGVDRIVGIKEATGHLDRVAALQQHFANRALLSGDDATAGPFVLMGGHGVISVISNVAPAEMVRLVEAARQGQAETVRRLQAQLHPLFAALFLEANPIPVKAAMALQGRIHEAYRLPLCEMQPRYKAQLKKVMQDGNWL